MSTDKPSDAGEALDYRKSGVDYEPLDAFKRACQKASASLQSARAARGDAEALGESAWLIEEHDAYVAHVEEALGTKTLVANAVYRLTGQSYYRSAAYDDVSTIVNDVITSGALPQSIAMFVAVGDSDFLADETRAHDLALGFAEACQESEALWSGGETQVLKDLLQPDALLLGGSCVGRVTPKSNRIRGDVQAGDDIIFLASSGVHTNGLTLCRRIAERLPQGYTTKLPSGRTYGEALLDPSVIYVRFVSACQRHGIPLRYAVHVTGHGWRKLMRLEQPFVYRIETLPEVPEVLNFVADQAKMGIYEAYGTLNMGVGFAVFVRPTDTSACLKAAEEHGFQAWRAGTVLDGGGRKAVEIPGLGISYGGESLQLR
jgi:phosphoribosylformylglycinamidine cyclo-ligase